jgi:aminoglycoside phosphotransferase (APT) family kinase protein
MIETAPPTLELPNDPALPGLTESAQPERMLALCREAFDRATRGRSRRWERGTVSEAIYQPGRACRIAYHLHAPEAIRPDIVYARWANDERRHASAVLARRSGLPIELYRFPRDRRMRQVRSMQRKDWLRAESGRWIKEWLGPGKWDDDDWRCSPIKYVPESRLVARLKGRWVGGSGERWVRAYVRVTRRDDAAEQVAKLRDLEDCAKALEFRVPHVLGVVPDAHLMATEFIRGQSLREACEADGTAILPNACGRLASIHKAMPVYLTDSKSVDLAVSSECMLDDLEAAVPGSSPACGNLRRWSERKPAEPAQRKFVHGDLHAGQVLFEGDQMWVVDWDRAGWGDPAQDLTNLAVEFESRALDSDGNDADELAAECVAGWRGAGETIDAQSIEWWATRAYVLRAWGLMRHLRPGWQAKSGQLLERAVQTQEHGVMWIQ